METDFYEICQDKFQSQLNRAMRMSGRKSDRFTSTQPNRMSDCQFLQPIEIRRPNGLRTKLTVLDEQILEV